METQKNENVIRRAPPTPPPKPNMAQNNPPPAEKNPLNKKLTIGIVIGVCTVVVALLIFLIVKTISSNAKLATPTNLDIVQALDGTTYFYVDKCNNAIKYRFEITNTQSGHKDVYESEKNNFKAPANIFLRPITYTVTCQYVGKTPKNTSNFCEKVNHKPTKKIATPTIELGTYENHNVLFVKTINDFSENVMLNFTLTYTDGQIRHPETDFVEIENNLNGYVRGYFNLDNIFTTQGAVYQLSVKVSQHVNTGEEAIYTASDLSSQIIYTVE